MQTVTFTSLMHPPMLANPYLNVLCDVLQDQRHENVLLMTVNPLGVNCQ